MMFYRKRLGPGSGEDGPSRMRQEEGKTMKMRRRAAPRKSRAGIHRQLEGALEQGRSNAGNVLAKATGDLRQSIQQARAVVTEARQTMADGTKNFQETMEQCCAAARAASTTAEGSAKTGEAGANYAIGLMMRGLQNLSERFAKTAPGGESPAN